jgi:hypothetical protein
LCVRIAIACVINSPRSTFIQDLQRPGSCPVISANKNLDFRNRDIEEAHARRI